MKCFPDRLYTRVSWIFPIAILGLSGPGCDKDKDKDKNETKDQAKNADSSGNGQDTQRTGTDTVPPLDTAPADDKLTWFRVVVESEEAPEVPFFIGFDGSGGAVVANGDERLPARGTVDDQTFEFDFPVIGTRLSMKKDGERFKGQWLAAFYFQRDFPAWAEAIDKPSPLARFPQAAAPPAAGVDVSGDWIAEVDVLGTTGTVFRQRADGAVSGGMVPPNVGDARYLSGKLSGKKMILSSFDGMHSYLVEAELMDDGTLQGAWSYTGVGRWSFTARRGKRPGMDSFVTVKTVGDAQTVTIPEIEKPPYQGSPVIVDYFGTWCPACLDLTPQLVQLHERYKDQGLQILAIALELETDREKVEQRIAAYKAKYDIPWEIQIRLVENFNDELPIEFDDVEGFPLTLFLRRDHTLAGMSTAFVSPAALEEHKAMVAQFEAWTREIVASQAPAAKAAPAKKSE